MNGLLQKCRLVMIWVMIIGLWILLSFSSQLLPINIDKGLNEFRRVWAVVAKEDLIPGDRLDPSNVTLELSYLSEEMATVVQSVSKVLDQFVYREFKIGKRIRYDSFGPKPMLVGPRNSVTVPILVKSEYAEGLKPKMRLRFVKARTQETSTTPVQNTKGESKKVTGSQNKNKEKKPPHKEKSSSSVNQPNSWEMVNAPLIVTLQAKAPSPDKKSTVLYVWISENDIGKIHELAFTDLIPVILQPMQGR